MLTSTVVADTNIVVISYGGPVRTEEKLDACEAVDAVVRRCGSARLLVVYDHLDPGRWEPRAMWADLQTAKLLRSVDRVALVADVGWIDDPDDPDGAARRVDVKGFRPERREAAMGWLQG